MTLVRQLVHFNAQTLALLSVSQYRTVVVINLLLTILSRKLPTLASARKAVILLIDLLLLFGREVGRFVVRLQRSLGLPGLTFGIVAIERLIHFYPMSNNVPLALPPDSGPTPQLLFLDDLDINGILTAQMIILRNMLPLRRRVRICYFMHARLQRRQLNRFYAGLHVLLL